MARRARADPCAALRLRLGARRDARPRHDRRRPAQLAGAQADRGDAERGAGDRRRRLAPAHSGNRRRRRARSSRAHLQSDVRPHRVAARGAQGGRRRGRPRPAPAADAHGAAARNAARTRSDAPGDRRRARGGDRRHSRRSGDVQRHPAHRPDRVWARAAPDSGRSISPRWRATSSKRFSPPPRRRASR